jgi:uncharacterized LabA/DUF88 family protein
MERIGVFMDVQNIYYTVKQHYNAHFDYQYFLRKVSQKGEIMLANAYATNKQDRAQQHFQSLLKSFGYDVKLIDYIQRRDGSSKGDWDVGISLDIVQAGPNLDCIILASGDGDYESLVKFVKKRYSIKFEVYGVPGLTAQKLIAVADAYVPIYDEYIIPVPIKW